MPDHKQSNRAGTHVGVRIPPAMVARLDAFIAAQPKPVSRPEAIRAFIEAGLHLMGNATTEKSRGHE